MSKRCETKSIKGNKVTLPAFTQLLVITHEPNGCNRTFWRVYKVKGEQFIAYTDLYKHTKLGPDSGGLAVFLLHLKREFEKNGEMMETVGALEYYATNGVT